MEFGEERISENENSEITGSILLHASETNLGDEEIKNSLAKSAYRFKKQSSDPYEIDRVLNEFNYEDKGVSDRLDFFIKDADVYTNMLIQIDKEGVADDLPEEIKKTLDPKEKC